MTGNSLMMRLQLQLAEKVTGPLKNIGASSKTAAGGLQATRDRLRELERQNTIVQRLKQQQAAFKATANQLKINQANLESLKRSGSATAAQIKSQTALVDRGTTAFKRQAAQLAQLRTRASNSGIGKLSTDEKRLGTEITRTTQLLRQQEQTLRRTEQLRSQRNRGLGTAAAIGGTGLGMRMTGQRGLTMGAHLIAPGMSYNQQMARVQALARLDGNSEDMRLLREQSRYLGATTMFSATEAAQGQAFLAMAGFTPENIMAAMPGMLNMSLAGDIDLARTADIASNISSGFGIDPAQMQRVADVLTATFTSANVNMEMLGETMKYMAPIARAAGVSLEDSAAMAALLGNVGIQGSTAGTQLRQMLTQLSTSGAEKLKKLGIQAQDTDGNLRDVTALLFELDQATKHMGSAERLGILKDVFDQRAMAGASELMQQIADGKLQEFAAMLRNSEGAAARVAHVMTDNLGGSLDELKSIWEDVGISIFEQNKDLLRGLVDSLTKVVEGVNNWIQKNPELAKWITRIAVGILALITAVGALLMVLAPMIGMAVMLKFGLGMLGIKFSGLIPIIISVGRALFTLGLSMLTNPLFLAISALALAGFLIYKNWDGIVWFFKDIWEQLKTAFNGGIGSLSAFILNWSPIGLFYKAMAVVLDYFGITLPENFTTFAGNIFSSFGNAVLENGKMLLVWFGNVFMSVFTWFMVDLPNAFSGFGGMLIQGLINGIKNAMGAVKDAISNVGSSVLNWFKEKLGIASPSKMFIRAGIEISNGAAIGISDGLPDVKRASLHLADTAMEGLPIIEGNTVMTTGGAFKFDTQAPIAATSSGQSISMGSDHVEIHIHGGGMDAQAIARAVALELDKRDRAKLASARSSLFDRS